MGSRPSLVRQVETALTSMLAPGRSKHADKKTGKYVNKFKSCFLYHMPGVLPGFFVFI